MDCSSTGTGLFAWAGWILSAVTALFGMAITTIGWRVRGNQAKALAFNKDVNDCIVDAQKKLDDFLDAAVDYWCENDSKVRFDQINVKHQRVIFAYKQLAQLTEEDWPKYQIARLRSGATLNVESTPRPVGAEDLRIRKLVKDVHDLMDSPMLKKRRVA